MSVMVLLPKALPIYLLFFLPARIPKVHVDLYSLAGRPVMLWPFLTLIVSNLSELENHNDKIRKISQLNAKMMFEK